MGRRASIGGEITIGTRKAKQALRELRGDITRFRDEVGRSPAPQIAGGVGRWTEINAKATAARNVLQQAYDIAKAPARANAWYADMVDGLTAVMGSADKARKHMGDLRLISDEQSLSDEDFEKLVEYSVRLQSLGYDAQTTADFLREMANAAEGMGKGLGSLSGLVSGLDKAGQRGEATLKNIMALTDEVPALRKVLEAAFGTSVAAEIEKMELTSAQLFAGIHRGMRMLETARPSLTEEGLSIEQRKMQTMGADAADNNGALRERAQLTEKERAEEIAKLEKQRAEVEARKAREAEKAAVAELQRRREVAGAEQDLQIAEASGDAERIARMEDRLDVLQESAALAKELGISEERAANFIRQQNELRRQANREADAAAQKREMELKAPQRAAEGEDLEIEKLRSRGRDRAADRMEKAKFLREEKERLKGEGFEDADAERRAAERQQAREDADYRQRTGRNRIRGAEPTGPGEEWRLLQPRRSDPRLPGQPSAIPGFDDTVQQVRQPAMTRVRELKLEQQRIEAQRAEREGVADGPMLERLDAIREELTGLREILNPNRRSR